MVDMGEGKYNLFYFKKFSYMHKVVYVAQAYTGVTPFYGIRDVFIP